MIAEQFIRQRRLQRQAHSDAYSTKPFHLSLIVPVDQIGEKIAKIEVTININETPE
ncbi:MAG: hypothetical protein ACLR17_01735 [Enterobacteriaceae bacterium]